LHLLHFPFTGPHETLPAKIGANEFFTSFASPDLKKANFCCLKMAGTAYLSAIWVKASDRGYIFAPSFFKQQKYGFTPC